MRPLTYCASLVVVAALVVTTLAVDAGLSDETTETQGQIVGESYYDRSMELPGELLSSAIDIHVHATGTS